MSTNLPKKPNKHTTLGTNGKLKQADGSQWPGSTPKVEAPSTVKQLVYGEYYNIYSRMMHPITTTWIQFEAARIMEWAIKEDSLRIYDYTDLQGYTPDTYHELCDTYPEIKLAHEFAMRRIGSRREKGALTRLYDGRAVAWTQSHYCNIFKNQQQEQLKAKQEQAQGAMDLLVEMTSFPRLPGNDAPVKQAELDARPTPEEVVRRESRGARFKPVPAQVAKKVRDSTVKGSGCRSEFKKTTLKRMLDEETNEEVDEVTDGSEVS